MRVAVSRERERCVCGGGGGGGGEGCGCVGVRGYVCGVKNREESRHVPELLLCEKDRSKCIFPTT